MNDSVMRSFAEQLNQAGSVTGERDHSGISGIDALAYRQQAINNALQHVAAGKYFAFFLNDNIINLSS